MNFSERFRKFYNDRYQFDSHQRIMTSKEGKSLSLPFVIDLLKSKDTKLFE